MCRTYSIHIISCIYIPENKTTTNPVLNNVTIGHYECSVPFIPRYPEPTKFSTVVGLKSKTALYYLGIHQNFFDLQHQTSKATNQSVDNYSIKTIPPPQKKSNMYFLYNGFFSDELKRFTNYQADLFNPSRAQLLNGAYAPIRDTVYTLQGAMGKHCSLITITLLLLSEPDHISGTHLTQGLRVPKILKYGGTGAHDILI